MQLRFLGKDSTPSNSPTLYSTDRDTYIIQGWKVRDAEIRAKLEMAGHETCVEVPARLLSHLAKDEVTGVVTSWAPPIVHVKEDGNFVIQGNRVHDSEALAQMDIPDHEDCVQVPKAAIKALLGEG